MEPIHGHVWPRYLPTWHLAKSLKICREILLLVPHPSKKDRFPFWTAHAYPIYNPTPKNL